MTEEASATPTENVDNAAASEATPSAADQVADLVKGQEPNFQWAEGVAGEGQKPEFLLEKFKSVSAQAEGYGELEKRFGSFTKAPEEYEVNLSQDLIDAGIEMPTDDPLLQSFTEWAKESNLHNDGYNKLIGMYLEQGLADNEADALSLHDEIKALGGNGQDRLNNLDSYFSANLSAEDYEKAKGVVVTKEAVEVFEQLIAKTRNAPIVAPNQVPQAPEFNAAQLSEMQNAKDEFGNYKMSSDPEYRKMVDKKYADLYGTHSHIQTG